MIMHRQTKISLILVLISFLTTSFIMDDNLQKPALFYKVRAPKIKNPNPPLLLLLHGVGGNEENLFSFADQLPGEFLVVSVRGPLTFGPESFAWFQVDFRSGKPVINKKQADDARLAILKFIEDLKSVEQFNDKKVYMLGFSQGGIMSYSAALTAPEKIAGIMVMSGRLLPEVKPLIAAQQQLASLKIFISHGKNDEVLTYQFALDADTYLRSLGLHPEFRSYEERHTVNNYMLSDAINWLIKVSH
jgi:phospholipase/carboxylesterase